MRRKSDTQGNTDVVDKDGPAIMAYQIFYAFRYRFYFAVALHSLL
jgi:hypothetical protein